MFDHTADIGIEIYGRTKKELFTNAARALYDVMIEIKEPLQKKRYRKKVSIEGADAADLLVNFLRELLYLFNGKRLVPVSCAITGMAARRLSATLAVVRFSPQVHTVRTEIKAVTYHGLVVERGKKGWRAKVIFDV
ncbi:MAG: archease [Syntrophaceae bacterium]|nr:archease [Syntrophaceae bacterium]